VLSTAPAGDAVGNRGRDVRSADDESRQRRYGALSESLAELERFLQRKNVTAAELIGLAADRRKAFAQMPLSEGNWRNYVPA